VEAIEVGGKIDSQTIVSKFVRFSKDGASTFKGCKMEVTIQVIKKYASFASRMHYFACKVNLVVKTLDKSGIFVAITKVLNTTYAYFCKSQRHLLGSNN
jgi:hypothetical protein